MLLFRIELLLCVWNCTSLPLHHTGQVVSELLLAAVGELEFVLLSIVRHWRYAFDSVRHINLWCVHIEVFHIFAELAELAYTPVRCRIVRAVTADHRTDVAKLIHALVGARLVLIPYALYFLVIHRYYLTFTPFLSHFVAVLLIIIDSLRKPPL